MKTISNENKAKCFAQYYGQKVVRWYQWLGIEDGIVDMKAPMQSGVLGVDKGWYLILTPLSKITNEDAIEAIQMNMPEKYKELKIDSKDYTSVCFSFKPNRGGRIMGVLTYDDLIFNVYQLLQSKGYALPYMEYSVEDLVELGVYKLRI